MTNLFEFLLEIFIVLADLLVLPLLLEHVALVLLLLPWVVGVLPDEHDLGHKDQTHRKVTAKDVGHGHEAEGRILLVT